MNRQAAFSSKDQRYRHPGLIYSWSIQHERHVDENIVSSLDDDQLMDLLNHPERRYPCVHVAGTKAKAPQPLWSLQR